MTGSTDFLYLSDNCGTSLAAGASCTLNYAFKPSVAAVETGANVISFSGGTGSPVSVNFTGTGTPTPTPTPAPTPTPTPTPTPIPTPTSQYYGSGIKSDGLTNSTVGSNGYFAYRFRATQSSALVNFRLKEQDNAVHTGYSGGTGGSSWIFQLQTDDGTSNHYPSGTVIASASEANPICCYFPLVTFSSPATLTAGQIYHLVVLNGDANPTVNYTSIDNIYGASPTTPAQPTLADTDWALLRNSGQLGSPGSWSFRAGHTPILQLNYGNGNSAGKGYTDTFSSSGRKTISGTNAVRETFTVSGSTRTVSGASIRLLKVSGTSALTIRLEQGNGTLIEQVTVPAASIGTSAQWVTVTFTSSRTLTAGQAYNLLLTAPSDTSYATWPMQEGVAAGFSSTTFFGDGYAQFATTGTNWSGDFQGTGASTRTDLDLQFYFTAQ